MTTTPRPDTPTLTTLIAAFLADLHHANRSPATLRTYAIDLRHFVTWYTGSLAGITVAVLRDYGATRVQLAPATRARSQATLSSFLTWACRHDYITTNPMRTIERVRRDPPDPHGLERAQIETILAGIPKDHDRDRLLFRMLLETGLRIGEALHLYVDDLDLTRDDEHLRVRGKGGQRRTLLLDDARLVGHLRAYLARTGYQHGLLFRAQKNGDGGPLRYQSVHERWTRYCAQAGVVCTLHQLRHTHATELVNAGVSLNTIRKRLGHKHLQTTLRYAEQSDATGDAELRAWRRRQNNP